MNQTLVSKKPNEKEELPVLVFDEIAGEWKLLHGNRTVSLGWNTQFMLLGDVVLASWTTKRMSVGDIPKLVDVTVDREIPACAIIQHKRPRCGVSVAHLEGCIGRALHDVLSDPNIVYGATLAPA